MKQLCYLCQALTDVPQQLGWLSAAEREVLGGMHVDKRRNDFVLGRWTAKQAIARMLGGAEREMDRWSVLPDPDRVPRVYRDGEPSSLTLSISHSSGIALCAVSSEGDPVGCDIERIEPRDDAFIRTFLTVGERHAVERAAGQSERGALTTLIWSAKESVLKAMLKGLSVDTWTIDVSPPALPLADVGRWLPLLARDVISGAGFRGWWRRERDFVLTLIGVDGDAPLDLGGDGNPAGMPVGWQ